MESRIAELTIHDREQELKSDSVSDAPATVAVESYALCLVGILVTDNRYNFAAFRSRMASLWSPRRGVTIQKIGDKRILFRFYHEIDLRNVLELGPWTFDRSLLVLRKLNHGEHPKTVDLNTAEFWVRIHNLTATYFSVAVGKVLGDCIGKFVSYDEKNANCSLFFDPYMRIRVELDIRKPLKREKKIIKVGGERITCKFRYEKLPNFCYICGKIGHIERYCEVLFHVPAEKIVRMWDESLRAGPRKTRLEREGEKWLVGRDGICIADVESIPASVRALVGNFGASPWRTKIEQVYGKVAKLQGEKTVAEV